LDIHKPKPWHGWREFLKEYGIIVLGVLTALGAEQLVESAHWAHRVAETRTQLNIELATDARNGLQWLSNARCLDAELAALNNALAQARRTGTFHAPVQPYTPWLDKFSSDAWLNARSLQVSDHMSADEVARYSNVYFYPTELVGNITTLHNQAGELAPLAHDLDHMSPTEADDLAARIGRIQELQTRTELAITLMIAGAETAGATVRPPPAESAEGPRACVTDPAVLLKALHSKHNGSRDLFAKLGLTFFPGQ